MAVNLEQTLDRIRREVGDCTACALVDLDSGRLLGRSGLDSEVRLRRAQVVALASAERIQLIRDQALEPLLTEQERENGRLLREQVMQIDEDFCIVLCLDDDTRALLFQCGREASVAMTLTEARLAARQLSSESSRSRMR